MFGSAASRNLQQPLVALLEYIRERGKIGGYHLTSDSEATNGRVVIGFTGAYESSIVYRQGERTLSLAFSARRDAKEKFICTVYFDDTAEWETPYGCMALTDPELERVQADIASF
ncbi:MAG: hypothetical protein DCC75_07715 [Proteobacteria bacterium]|nr:MAG: hypothetical protein DCC75_07715 [Pseudomonadota bacterium]